MSDMLVEIRKRDAASAPTWFKSPDNGPARAFQDRRWLLADRDALYKVAQLASELCTAIDNSDKDIGGSRFLRDILADLGPALDAVEKHERV